MPNHAPGDDVAIERIGNRRHRITWQPKASTKMTPHTGATTVIYHQDGQIERLVKTADGRSVLEVQDIKRGIPYTRKAGTTHQVRNISDHPLDADKDERPDGDQNPDATVRSDG